MSNCLTLYYCGNNDDGTSRIFNKWTETVYPYTSHSLRCSDFDKNSRVKRKYHFFLKGKNYPVSVAAMSYLDARLRFWTAFKQKKRIKYLRFEHDRLFTKVTVSDIDSRSPIGLSNVSILQQNFLSVDRVNQSPG